MDIWATDMHGRNVQPGQAFAGQKLKFTKHLSDDLRPIAGLQWVKIAEFWHVLFNLVVYFNLVLYFF